MKPDFKKELNERMNMEMNKNKNVTVFGNLTWIAIAILAALKLSGIITCSWWIVFIPLWLPLAVFLGVLALILIGIIVISCFSK